MSRMRDPAHVYPAIREIDPTLVARVVDENGADAGRERWHWVTQRDLSDLTTEGRRLMRLGQKWEGPRPARRRGPAPGWARAKQALAINV